MDINKNMQYIVTITHNFDANAYAYAFSDQEQAENALQHLWEDYYNEEIAANSSLDEEQCFHEEAYAKIAWIDGLYTEFHCIPITPYP